MNLVEKKALLKDYLSKIIFNKVAYINGNVVRAADLTHTMCLDIEELDLGDVKVTIRPESFSRKVVYSSITLKMYENNKVTMNNRIPSFINKRALNFVSQLNKNQIEKLLSALEPIVSDIDREISLIDEEEKASELKERNNIIKKIKKNLKSEIKFDKLTTSELKTLNKLIEKGTC